MLEYKTILQALHKLCEEFSIRIYTPALEALQHISGLGQENICQGVVRVGLLPLLLDFTKQWDTEQSPGDKQAVRFAIRTLGNIVNFESVLGLMTEDEHAGLVDHSQKLLLSTDGVVLGSVIHCIGKVSILVLSQYLLSHM